MLFHPFSFGIWATASLAGVAPTLSVAPSISGTVDVGEELTGTDGEYTGTAPITVGSYQWQYSADGETGWADIDGATNAAFTITAGEMGYYLRRGEVASNAAGSANRAYSAATETAVPDASLGAVVTTPTGTINLTSEGTDDWVHCGLSSKTDVNRKNGATTQIGTITKTASTWDRFTGAGISTSWTNGTPTASSTNSVGLYFTQQWQGYSLTAPADTTERTLVLYCGGWQSTLMVEASLSDESAADILINGEGNLSDSYFRRIEITYRAASAGQTLSVSVSQETTAAGGKNISFMGVTLS